jgi:hypothetical protein
MMATNEVLAVGVRPSAHFAIYRKGEHLTFGDARWLAAERQLLKAKTRLKGLGS